MSNAKVLFENADIWSDHYYGRHDERFKKICELIPSDVGSLLDVGCGNGAFFQYLLASNRSLPKIHGTDYSAEALRHVPAETTEAAIDELPFADGSYEVVTCLEVLEHLPQDVFRKGCSELARVSSKYIIVTTPNNEEIDSYHISCPQCFCKFNPNYHVRSFDQNKMKQLFSSHGFEARQVFFMGPLRNYLVFSYFERQKMRRDPLRWFVRTPVPCPACGELVQPRAPVSDTRDEPKATLSNNFGLRGVAKALVPQWITYSWIGAIYEKK